MFLAIYQNSVVATSGDAIVNGDWEDASTWLFNGVNRKPGCGDTIIIPAGRTVTVESQENLAMCGTSNVMHVYGTLQYVTGNKVDFPCGSWVYIMAGGLVKKVTPGGGNSTLISICGSVEWKAGDGNLSGVDTLGGHGTLPVEWLSVEGNFIGKKVIIEWSTATEINNDYFELTRSQDRSHFESIGLVKGAGNSTETTYYNYIDENPYFGVSYYRLEQVDYDGTVNYSKIIAVEYKNDPGNISDLVFYSDGADRTPSLSFIAAGEAQLKIISLNGSEVRSIKVTYSGGNNRIALIELNNLSGGLYLMNLYQNSGSVSAVKFVIQ